MIYSIDKQIEENGLYSNKPDFILWSMREYYNLILLTLFRGAEATDILSKKDEFKDVEVSYVEVVRHILFQLNPDLRYFSGELGKPILVRVPVNLLKNIEEINVLLGRPYKNIQEYCRYAVSLALENEWDRINTFRELIEGTKNDISVEKFIETLKEAMRDGGILHVDWTKSLPRFKKQ